MARKRRQLRLVGWGALALLLALPALAMHVTPEVKWSGSDFLVAAILLGALGLSFEAALQMGHVNRALRAGAVIATLCTTLTVWMNGAVGIIGDEGNPLNLGFPAMLALGALAACMVRGRPRALFHIAAMLAAGQLALAVLAAARDLSGSLPALMLALIWAVVAACFRKASASEAGVTAGRAEAP